jgi:hypothetical protein
VLTSRLQGLHASIELPGFQLEASDIPNIEPGNGVQTTFPWGHYHKSLNILSVGIVV